jgi:hypothetical protein
MSTGEPIVFALSSYTIKQDGNQFFVSKTWERSSWSKPYSSLRHACTAIARNLQREWTEREQRRASSAKRASVKRRAA